jgi:hypothetical protein
LINIKYGFMVESKSLLVKHAKANENAQGLQNWNRQMAPNQEGMQSSMDDPTQLKSKEFQYINGHSKNGQ